MFLPIIMVLRVVMLVPVSPCVKVAGVLLVLELRHKLGLLPQEGVPVNVVEERMLLDLVRTPCAQPVKRVLLQQLGDEVSSIVGQ